MEVWLQPVVFTFTLLVMFAGANWPMRFVLADTEYREKLIRNVKKEVIGLIIAFFITLVLVAIDVCLLLWLWHKSEGLLLYNMFLFTG